MATHSSLDGHDTSVKVFATLASLAHAAAPPVGSIELSTSPAWSTAMHKPVDGQDTPVIAAGDANGGWSSARIGLAQLKGEAASAGLASARRHPTSMIERSPASHGTLRHVLQATG
jgi:hypothetical protein